MANKMSFCMAGNHHSHHSGSHIYIFYHMARHFCTIIIHEIINIFNYKLKFQESIAFYYTHFYIGIEMAFCIFKYLL